MRLTDYIKDRWVSIFILILILTAGGGLLWLVETPPAVACVVEGFYMAGFFLIFLQDYLARKGFYDKLLEATKEMEDFRYLSEFLEEPYFLEGKLLYQILKRTEKCSNDQAAQQQRELKEYKDYVEIWVHEVKTPIAVSRLIMENNKSDVTKSLSDEMDRLDGYVEQMLYYSKSSSLQDDCMIRSVSLREMVMTAVKKQARLMISGKVLPRFENLDGQVLADPKWMEFILGQIISNSVKYRSLERSPELVFSASHPDGRKEKQIVLSIADNGIGIAPEDLGRIFRRGFTGKNGRQYAKSTGIGLYLCKILCQKMEIGLTASSKEGAGTVLTLTFVRAPEEDGGNRKENYK